MAKKKAEKKVNAVQEEKAVWPVRLDLNAALHARLEECAHRLGLSKSSYARMAVIERIEADEGKRGSK